MAEAPVFDLDLDELQPEPKKVKVGGQEVLVYPPKFNDLLSLVAASNALQKADGESDVATAIEKMGLVLDKVAPDIKSKGIELTVDQFSRLMTFIFTMVTPSEQKELQKAGIELNPEKKGAEDSPSSP